LELLTAETVISPSKYDSSRVWLNELGSPGIRSFPLNSQGHYRPDEETYLTAVGLLDLEVDEVITVTARNVVSIQVVT
jgi:hypothetical protein